MKEITKVETDIAKSVFSGAWINAVGDIVVCRKLRRSELIGRPEISAMLYAQTASAFVEAHSHPKEMS